MMYDDIGLIEILGSHTLTVVVGSENQKSISTETFTLNFDPQQHELHKPSRNDVHDAVCKFQC